MGQHSKILLIHRVFMVYFECDLKANCKWGGVKTFLENNTDIQENSYRKYMNEKGVLDLLNQLKLKFGSNFLEEENSIQWIQNGKFIHRGNIPRFILEKYCLNASSRRRGIRSDANVNRKKPKTSNDLDESIEWPSVAQVDQKDGGDEYKNIPVAEEVNAAEFHDGIIPDIHSSNSTDVRSTEEVKTAEFHDVSFIQLERRFIQLEDDTIFKWSDRKIAVYRSRYRNVKTGNSIGYGVHLQSDIRKDGVIGIFTGQVVVYAQKEIKALVDSQSTNQFYTLQLNLRTDVKREYRINQGKEWKQNVKYMAYLDCTEAAKNGQCLVSFSNSPKGCYTFYGSKKVVANAKLAIEPGSIKPSLKALADLPAGTEILWKYNGLGLPTTFSEEKYSKVHPEEFPDEWNYPFSREQFITFIRCNMKGDRRYRAGIKMLQEATEESDADVLNIWYGDSGLLQQLEKYLVSVDTNRKPSFFVHSEFCMVEKIQQDQLGLLHRNIQKRLPETNAKSIFDCAKIFILLFNKAKCHYTFCTVFVQKKFIGYYDSDKRNKTPSEFPLELIYTWLQYEHEALQRTFHRMDWTFQVVEVKPQGNNVDCGFHAIRNTLLLQMDFPLLEYEVCSYNNLPHDYARNSANIMF